MNNKGMNLSLYPATTRIKRTVEYQVTEKIDGSNLVICNTGEGLVIATRSRVFLFTDKEEIMESNLTIRGLKQWAYDHYESLQNDLLVGSAICVEWVSAGNLKYEEYHHRPVIFGKARLNIDEDPKTWKLTKLNYNVDLLIYPFKDQEIPEYIDLVPLVTVTNDVSIENLDRMYDGYTEKVGRNVEGFVIEDRATGSITKYVRMKTGKLQPHKE